MHEAVKRVFAGATDALPSERDRGLIYARQRGLCFSCGKPLLHATIYGHLIPRSRGGLHDHTNRIGIHVECERGRGDRMPTDDEVTKQNDLSGRNRS